MKISAVLPDSIKAFIKQSLDYKIPVHLSRNFRNIDEDGIKKIKESLKKNYFSQRQFMIDEFSESYLNTDEGKKDLQDHLFLRLDKDRKTVIPWLDNTKSLKDASILEIGCGTGASTVALSEQGAKVIAVDIDELSIKAARDRCRVYDLNVDFATVNATEVHTCFPDERFDFIIFYAALEHMTYDERINAIKNTWNMLPEGGLWCVIETPNRLWYHDGHTSKLPFYLWLPDDLALKYSKFSSRKRFNTLYLKNHGTVPLDFFRWGRGMSFHEFDIALGRVENLKVISSLKSFQRDNDSLWWYKKRTSEEYSFEVFLKKHGPEIHEGFYQSWLNLVIEKS